MPATNMRRENLGEFKLGVVSKIGVGLKMMSKTCRSCRSSTSLISCCRAKVKEQGDAWSRQDVLKALGASSYTSFLY